MFAFAEVTSNILSCGMLATRFTSGISLHIFVFRLVRWYQCYIYGWLLWTDNHKKTQFTGLGLRLIESVLLYAYVMKLVEKMNRKTLWNVKRHNERDKQIFTHHLYRWVIRLTCRNWLQVLDVASHLFLSSLQSSCTKTSRSNTKSVKNVMDKKKAQYTFSFQINNEIYIAI